MTLRYVSDKMIIGRSEWCGLFELDIPCIRAKIDTGAKTSAIHAFNIQPIRYRGQDYVKFNVHPIQRNQQIAVSCRAKIIDQRYVMSSNGHRENRFVIETELTIGDEAWPIEVTLSNRDPLRFRMLLGRQALQYVLIDPSHIYMQGRLSRQAASRFYRV